MSSTTTSPASATQARQQRLAEIAAGLQVLWTPGAVHEIRALGVGGRKKRTDAGWFDDVVKAAAAALQCDERGARGVYFTCNPCRPELLARGNSRIIEWADQTTADSEILRRTLLPCDFDPDRPSGIGATDQEKAAAAELAEATEDALRARGWPYPYIIDSGNGWYRAFRMDLPNDDESRDLIKRVLQGIATLTDAADVGQPHAHLDLGMFNAARIIRVPSTTNRKGDSTTDRPHRIAQFFPPTDECPVEIVPRELLDEAAALATDAPKSIYPAASTTSANGNVQTPRLDVEKWLASRNIEYRAKNSNGGRAYLIACPFGAHGSASESAIWQAANGMLTYECKHDGCKAKKWADLRDAIGKPADTDWNPPLTHQGHSQPAGPSTRAKTTTKYRPVAVGEILFDEERGNYGDNVADLGDSCSLHFKNPATGAEATVTLPKSQLLTQDGRRLDGNETEPRQFNVYSMADLDALDLHVDMVLDRALMTGAPGVDGGTFKVLKTSLALEQGLSMAIGPGAKWLDHFAVLRKATSVYFAGEGGLVPIRDTLRRQCDHKGVALRDVDGFYLCDDVPRLDSTADMERAAAILRERKADFSYFDPAYLMMGAQAANASNVYAMGAMLGRMLQACREAGATPKILHHFNRAKGTAPNDAPDLADLSQAGCAEIAGQWGLIGRTRPYDAEQPGEHDLVLSIGSRIGFSSKWALHVSEGTPDSPGGRYWRPEVTPFAESRQRDRESRAAKREEQVKAKEQQDLDAARRAIVAVMARQEQPATRPAIQERTPIQRARFVRAWASLTDDHTIIAAGKARQANGHTSPTYRVEANPYGL